METLLRENEKLKNDLRANRKNMYTAAANTSNYQAAMVGTKLLGQLGSTSNFGLGGLSKNPNTLGFGSTSGYAKIGDGSNTERNFLSSSKDVGGGGDKSFVSSSGLGGGAQLGVGGLDNSLINNILSTPSSEKSQGKSRISNDDQSQM